ncbi:M48 family metallopeptidase [Hyphobacterium sp. HN65]|uniref:M48 family metallopeptidase n=1 Tax=Hyphobacterium lacteum TaxID=3116575 RepID=A0ABU7LTJ4_9PROT|nr:M48 family metallopeptidase [Hyphobacterium sp. HN65]MEE2527175.1 M48 family metallopeptidase [Hyphobacterium sp. HN65]
MRIRKISMNRRDIVLGLAAGSIIPVSGCAQNDALGRSQLQLVSQNQLMSLSQQAWTDALQRERVLRDPGYNRRLQRVGANMVSSTGMTDLDWEFVVIDSDQVNAWVLPNGKVAFYRGILDIMEEDGHIATVMGHEMGHVAGRHAAERASQQRASQIGLQIAGALLQQQGVNFDQNMAAALGAGVTYGVILPYSRQHEFEADRLGVDYMVGAGYEPHQAIDFWLAMSTLHQDASFEFMSTHPSDEARVDAMRAHIASRGYS